MENRSPYTLFNSFSVSQKKENNAWKVMSKSWPNFHIWVNYSFNTFCQFKGLGMCLERVLDLHHRSLIIDYKEKEYRTEQYRIAKQWSPYDIMRAISCEHAVSVITSPPSTLTGNESPDILGLGLECFHHMAEVSLCGIEAHWKFDSGW